MAGSIVAASVFGLTAGTFAYAATAFAVNLVLSTVVNRIFAPNVSAPTSAPDPGVESQLQVDAKNKVGVVYGSAWVRGAQAYGTATGDYRTAYYTLLLSESLENGMLNSLSGVYWQEYRLTLDNNGWVTGATDAAGNSVTDFNGNIRVQFFANGLPADRSTLPQIGQYTTSSNTYSGYSLAVVTVNYNRDKRIARLEDMTFCLTNAATDPGVVFRDYMSSERYGCALAASQIDTDSLTALSSYSNNTLSYIDSSGNVGSSRRYAINGVVNTGMRCWDNLSALARSCGSLMRVNNSNGKYGVYVDRPATAVFSINEDYIKGQSSITTAELSSVPNEVEVRFKQQVEANGSVSNVYRGQQNTFNLSLPDNLIPDAAPTNQYTINYDFCGNEIQAKRLAAIDLNQNALDLSYTFECDHRVIGLQSGDVINVSIALNGWVNKPFRILSVTENEDPSTGGITVSITAKEYGDNIYVDSTVVQYNPAPNLSVPSPRALADFTPTAPVAYNSVTVSAVPQFTLAAVAPNNGMRAEYVEFYYATSADGQSPSQIPQSQFVLLHTERANTVNGAFADGQNIAVEIDSLAKGTYYYRCRFFNSIVASNLSPISSSHIWSSQPVDVQDFSSSGVWTKPTQGQQYYEIEMWGAGGGGGYSTSGAAEAGVTNFTSSGTYTVPTGTAQIYVSGVGPGGDGSTVVGASGGWGGGGGAGAVANGQLMNVSAGDVVTVTIDSESTEISTPNWTITLGGGGDASMAVPGTGGSYSYTGTLAGALALSEGSAGGFGNDSGSGVGGSGGSSLFGVGGLGGIGGIGVVGQPGAGGTGYGSGGGGGGNGAPGGNGTGGFASIRISRGSFTVAPGINATANATGSWTVPAGITSIQISGAAAGGGGGKGAGPGQNFSQGGGGGGGGQYFSGALSLQAGDVVTYSVGRRGAGASGGTVEFGYIYYHFPPFQPDSGGFSGQAGANTTVTITRGATTLLSLTAAGGGGGATNDANGPGGAGGTSGTKTGSLADSITLYNGATGGSGGRDRGGGGGGRAGNNTGTPGLGGDSGLGRQSVEGYVSQSNGGTSVGTRGTQGAGGGGGWGQVENYPGQNAGGPGGTGFLTISFSSSASATAGGGGGGGGGYIRLTGSIDVLSNTEPIIIGAGGSAGSADTPTGGEGGFTSVHGWVAEGGNGGQGQAAGGAGGAGGGNNINADVTDWIGGTGGTAGGTAAESRTLAAGGGGGAGVGAGSSVQGGDGGSSSQPNGTLGGGGGSGGSPFTGAGTGGGGRVIIRCW